MKSNRPLRKTLVWSLVCALLLAALPLSAQAADLQAGNHDTQFTFSDTGIQVTAGDYDGYEIEGTALTITAPGRYLLTGKCADGSVKVKKGVTGVTVTLAGLDLTSADTAPLAFGKSSQGTLYVMGGSENTLTDTARNNDDNCPDNLEAENAVIKCKDGSQVTIRGTGTLRVVANGKNGIKSGMTTQAEGEAWLSISDVDLDIVAPVNDAINAEERLDVLSGSLTISAADDAIHCDRTLNIGAAENVALGVEEPVIRVSKCNEGLEGADLTVYSGDITIHAEDDGLNAANSDLGNYPFTLTIHGGKVTVDTTAGDGIDSNGTLTITGGDIRIFGTANGDNAPLDADGAFTVTGGTVLAVGMGNMAQEPSEKQAFVSFGGGMGGFRGMGRPNWDGEDRFPGGRGEVTLPRDPNAPKPMDAPEGAGESGWTPPQLPDGEAPQMPDGAFPQMPDGQAEGGSAVSIAQGDTLTVTDSQGKVLATATAPRAANYVFFTAPAVAEGDSYALTVNGRETATTQGVTQGRTMSFGGPREGTQPPVADLGFEDVKAGDWFYEAVAYVCGRRLMNGTSDTTFEPLGGTTRGMVWTTLARQAGVDTTGGETWYAAGQRWAVEKGISDGARVTGTLTRQELVTMLYRLAGSPAAAGDLSGFPDAASVGTWAVDAVRWAVEKGILTGKSGGLLDPTGSVTRGEMAALLQRYQQSVTPA